MIQDRLVKYPKIYAKCRGGEVMAEFQLLMAEKMNAVD